MLNNYVPDCVVRLLNPSGPPNVSWFIISRLVGMSIQRVIGGWPSPHIFSECVETVHPPIAYPDTLCAIKPVRYVLGVVAARNHAEPRIPEGKHNYLRRPSPRSIESIAFARADVQNALMVVPRAEQKLLSLVWKPTATRKLTCSLSGSVSGTLMVMVANNLEINVGTEPII